MVKSTLRIKAAARTHVRTIRDHHGAGGDPAAVRLSGTAELPAALQCRADAAGADRAHDGGKASARAGALGADPVVGEGSARVIDGNQCAGRNRTRRARLSSSYE